MQSDPAVVEAEGERAGSPFPATVAARTLAARARRSGGAPPPSAADHKGCDLSLNPRPRAGRDPAPPSQNRGKRPPPFTAIIFTGLRSCCSTFLVLPAKPSRCSVELWSQLPAARYSLLSPLPLKFPGAVVVLFVLGGHHFQFAFKLLLLWLLLLGLLSVLASALGLLAERFWICRHCWFSRGRR